MVRKMKPATKPATFEKRVVLLPHVVAETVLMERGWDPASSDAEWFIEYVDHYIRWLHANKRDWKKRLEKSPDPRPFVYGFVNHWLDAYEKNPVRFQQRAKAAALGRAPLTVHHRRDWEVRAYDEDMRVVDEEFDTLREAKEFARRMRYPYPMRWRDVHKYGRRIGLDLVDNVNNVWASIRFRTALDTHALPVRGLRGFGEDCALTYHWKPVGKRWRKVREDKVPSLTGQSIRTIRRHACGYWTYTHEVPGKGVLYVTGGVFRGEPTPPELLKPPRAGRGVR